MPDVIPYWEPGTKRWRKYPRQGELPVLAVVGMAFQVPWGVFWGVLFAALAAGKPKAPISDLAVFGIALIPVFFALAYCVDTIPFCKGRARKKRRTITLYIAAVGIVLVLMALGFWFYNDIIMMNVPWPGRDLSTVAFATP